ncbi:MULTISPECIES: hypothetical protein [Paraburkholderia]|uniref:hypothetical protein n=1 Tax=Paraburkholderia TaxID=1822464 RepID=UPI00035DC754|nr:MULTISPECIES: hypothetical protein [Paraburkholderia]MDH6147990.1 hypothetical protein [Paraburkholderia sp. WSM4179]
MDQKKSTMHRWARAALFMIVLAAQSGCSTTGGMAGPMPDDAHVSTGQITGQQYLTTVMHQASGAPSASVGAGGFGGGIDGVGLGAGLSFDISRLFEKPADSPVKIYRYGVKLPDGSTRDVDSPLDLRPGDCVNVIDSRQPGYPGLATASDC